MRRLVGCYLSRYLRDYRLLIALVGGVVLMALAGLSWRIDQARAGAGVARVNPSAGETRGLQETLIPRPPSKLSFLSAAPASSGDEAAVVRPHLVDQPEPKVADRSYLFGAQALDWSWVVVFFFSLMAIAMSYDAIVGEKAEGTLRVVMSRSVSRLSLLASKFLAVWLVVSGAFLVGALVSLLLVLTGRGERWSGADWVRLALGLAVILLFLAFNALLGLVASVSAKTPEASLNLAVGAWVALVFLLPGAIVIAASYVHPIPSESEFRRNQLLIQDSHSEVLRISSSPLQEIVDTRGIGAAEKRLRIEALEARMHAAQEQALAQRERDYANLRRDYLGRVMARREWIDRWSVSSPYSLASRALERVAQTGLAGERDYLGQVGRFEPVFTAFVTAERQAHRGQAREGFARASVEDQSGEAYEMRGLVQLSFDEVRVPASRFPLFVFTPAPLGRTLAGAAWDLAWLLASCSLLIALVCRRFMSYDLR